jgi:hypothetical protein
VKVLRAIAPIAPEHTVVGQFAVRRRFYASAGFYLYVWIACVRSEHVWRRCVPANDRARAGLQGRPGRACGLGDADLCGVGAVGEQHALGGRAVHPQVRQGPQRAQGGGTHTYPLPSHATNRISTCGAFSIRAAQVRIQLREVPGGLFRGGHPNELVVRLQPNEAIYLKMMTKVPGLTGISDLAQTELDLSYRARCVCAARVCSSYFLTRAAVASCGSSYTQQTLPDAYERLILDVTRGDHTHFVRSDELDAAWAIFTPLLHHLERQRVQPVSYKFGSRGPGEADDLVRRMGYRRSEGYTWQSPYLGVRPGGL